MSKQQRDAIDAALRAEPFNLSHSTAEHRKVFDAFAIRPYPADVAAVDVTLGGVGVIELTVAGNAAEPNVLFFHGGGYVAGSARTGTHLAAELAQARRGPGTVRGLPARSGAPGPSRGGGRPCRLHRATRIWCQPAPGPRRG
jgi:hypothetical protein